MSQHTAINCAGLALVLLACAAACGQIAGLTDDAYIAPAPSGINFGALPVIAVGGAAGYEGLIRFDLTTLPSGTVAADVARATLRLYAGQVDATGSINIYAADSAWAEATVTGTSAPGAATLVAGAVPLTTANAWLVVDVTSQVRAWFAGAANDGFLLVGSGGLAVFFDSKESLATSHTPLLEISLIGPQGATGPAGPAGAAGAISASRLTRFANCTKARSGWNAKTAAASSCW